ncbi:hypothetical protein BDW59DRAFT_135814 [Aspergillus cavernicola]|uniref:Uncharacterized protein n=1 Tax=Aspergillus cavernicola TaxID=176166 RepID=A0ABR4HMZ8_9EURO
MDEARADEDVREEVNFLIYDYMICMAIYRSTSVIPDSPEQMDLNRPGETIRILKSILPPTETFLADLQIKTQIFEIIQIFTKPKLVAQPEPTLLAEMASRFVLTCNAASMEALGSYATEVAIQLCIYAMYQNSNNSSSDGCIENPVGIPGEQEAEKIPEYITHILPSMGISNEVYLEAIRRTRRVNGNGKGPLLNTVVEIMKLLKPPILTQLEKGKLDGLSHVETEELKRRVGFS